MRPTVSRRAGAASAATLLTAVLGISCAAPSQGPTPRPDLFLLTVDTLRADAAPPHPRGVELAPFLGSLAAGSTVFPSAHATSPWTVPSVVTLATGAYPHTHGVTMAVQQRGTVYAQPVIPELLPTVAELLQAAGYRTYAVLANGHMGGRFGFRRGFDRFACPGFVDAAEARQALDPWLDEIAAGDGPFFLWLHLFDPHMPYNPREPWFDRYGADVTAEELAVIEEAKQTWPRLPPAITDNHQRYAVVARALYESEVSYLDAAVADLYRRLPALDDALLVFTADHGEEFWEHGRLGHGNTLHGESIHVPLWVRAPGGGRGAADDRVASLVDVPPTLLAAAGIAPPEWWPGSTLTAPADDPTRPVLSQLAKISNRNLEALVGPRWKLVAPPGSGDPSLYDVAGDPGELHDVAADNPEVVATLSADLARRISSLPPAGEVDTAPVDPAELDALRELGYVE